MRVRPKEIILEFKRNSRHARKTASSLGIHRSTVYRWVKKAKTTRHNLSSWGLVRRSTRPKHLKGQTITSEELSQAVTLRRKTGWTAERIVGLLKLKVSSLTLHRRFKNLGLVRKYGYYRRPKIQETKHMHAKNTFSVGYLQMDVKYITPELSGLPYTCFEYAVIDIFSRYKEAVILNHLDQDGSMIALLEILPKLPFKPIFIQTDNGLEFQERFDQFLKEIGLKHHFVHKRTPNENALIERSFRTDECFC
jgi:transposase